MSLTDAVSKIAGKIPYDAQNPEKNYAYTSADAIFAAVRDALAEEGLGVWMQEDDIQIIPQNEGIWKRPWWRVRYGLALTADAGPPEDGQEIEYRTVVVPWVSDKSLASAATYALKYYLRSKLLIATGEDDDLDAQPGGEGTDTPTGPEPEPVNPYSVEVGRIVEAPDTDWPSEKARLKWLFKAARDHLEACESGSVCQTFMVTNTKLLGELPEKGLDALVEIVEAAVTADAQPDAPQDEEANE